jgi:peroxiredoxin
VQQRSTLSISALLLLVIPAMTWAAPDPTSEAGIRKISQILNRRSSTLDEHQGNMRTALKQVQTFRASTPTPPASYLGTAALLASQAQFNLESYHEALGEVDIALKYPLEKSQHALALFIKSILYQQTGDELKAISVLYSLKNTFPNDRITPQAWFLLAELLAGEGRAPEAIAVLDTFKSLPASAPMAAQITTTQGNLRLIGTTPKAFSTTAMDGRTISLAQYRGKVVLLDFWATWCGPCRQSMPEIKSLYAKYNPKGFDILAVSLDHKKSDVEGYVMREGMPWRQVADGRGWRSEIARLYGVTAIPTTYLIDRRGNIAGVNLRGKRLEDTVKRLLKKS